MKKVFLCLLAATVYTATAVPVDHNDMENTYHYPRFIDFPDGEGNLHKIDLEDRIDTALIEDMTRNPDNNQYLLFTRSNPTSSHSLYINDVSSVLSSNFNPSDPTVVIIHGWLSNQNTGINPTIREAYLGQGETNVIVMDWRRLALSNYITAANGVPAVGRGVGQFLDFLSSVTGAPLDSMHIVGFSLGAHVAGNAGRELGGKVARVTGLDPAGPLFNLNRNRLSSSDAIYVEAIHTDGGYTVGGLGIGSNVAQADFYANGGISQPGCLTNICNHNIAWKFFAASVSYNHLIAKKCSNSIQVTLDTCRGETYPMGNGHLDKNGSGMYRANTGRSYPY